MTPRLIGEDPSKRILALVAAAIGPVPAGYDMPPADAQGRRVFLTLSSGAMRTLASQRFTLTLSAYAHHPRGHCDHAQAVSLWRRGVEAILAGRTLHPLIDAQVQSGPIDAHDGALDVDYVYGAVLLDVAATTTTQHQQQPIH